MLRRVKEINPFAVLVVCGCYAQVAKNELEQIPEIDIKKYVCQKQKTCFDIHIFYHGPQLIRRQKREINSV